MMKQVTEVASSATVWFEEGSKLFSRPKARIANTAYLLKAARVRYIPSSRLLSTLAAAVVIAASGAYLLVTDPVHLTQHNTATAAIAPKSSNTPVANANTCNGPEQASPLFKTCPSLAVDFATQQTGQINPDLFNVYTGAPEANQEAEYYTSNLANIKVSGGSLQLTALNEATQGYRYTSGRVDTKGKQDFLYGKLVVRAMLPNGIGAWPAIWMLPSAPKYASLSPDTNFYRYLNDGEIDLAEAAGVQSHVIYGIAHSLAYPPDGPDRSYYSTKYVADSDTTYHNYEVDWTPTSLTFLVDGTAFFSISKQAGADYKSWPYDQPFYLILNLAVGGTMGAGNKTTYAPDGVDTNALPATMKVQSVNYYQYVAPR